MNNRTLRFFITLCLMLQALETVVFPTPPETTMSAANVPASKSTGISIEGGSRIYINHGTSIIKINSASKFIAVDSISDQRFDHAKVDTESQAWVNHLGVHAGLSLTPTPDSALAGSRDVLAKYQSNNLFWGGEADSEFAHVYANNGQPLPMTVNISTPQYDGQCIAGTIQGTAGLGYKRPPRGAHWHRENRGDLLIHYHYICHRVLYE